MERHRKPNTDKKYYVKTNIVEYSKSCIKLNKLYSSPTFALENYY